MAKQITLLITSVGSLVGQNILDALEYGDFYRRDKVRVIGTNSIAENSNNFRCDSCYLVPNTSSDEFKPLMTRIISEVRPDLILSGRDEDTEVMWRLMESNSNLTGVLPYGNLQTLIYALDKSQTWKFTQRHGLPFAETFLPRHSKNKSELAEFVEKVGFPLIAKPIRGFASKGVFYIRSWGDIEIIANYDDYMLQEYLGSPKALEEYFEKLDSLTPLFAHAPNIFHHSCHTVIGPNGDIAPIFISRNEHNSGVTVGFRKVENAELEKLAIEYAQAVYDEGGAGPLTIQFRQDREGNWKAQEMNMRTNGNTFPRLVFGQDDLGLIMKHFVPEVDFPIFSTPEGDIHNDIIGKTYFCNRLERKLVDQLKNGNKVNMDETL